MSKRANRTVTLLRHVVLLSSVAAVGILTGGLQLAGDARAQSSEAPAAAPNGTAAAGGGEKTPQQLLIDKLNEQQRMLSNPVPPEKILEHKKATEDTARASARAEPKFLTAMKDVPLDPAETVPKVQFDLRQMATINFVDMSGQPWLIEENGCDWSAGYEGEKPRGGSHVLVLRTTELVAHGSLVCRLQGLSTPVVLRLESGKHEHHLRFDARVPRMGPKSKPPPYDLGGSSLVAGDDVMSGFLYGIMPADAVALPVDKGNGRTKAWRMGKLMIVRTNMVLLSPTPLAAANLDGVFVYKLKPMPVLRFDDDGNDVEIRIEGAKVVRASIPGDVIGDGAVDSDAMGGSARSTGRVNLTVRRQPVN